MTAKTKRNGTKKRVWITTAISIQPPLLGMAKERAFAQRRSFSSYIVTLIERDLLTGLDEAGNGKTKAA